MATDATLTVASIMCVLCQKLSVNATEMRSCNIVCFGMVCRLACKGGFDGWYKRQPTSQKKFEHFFREMLLPTINKESRGVELAPLASP